MVSMMSKQLGEFLLEKQEPFILEVYLVERGYHKHRFLESCSSTKATTCMKSSVSRGLKGRKKFLPNCTEIVRSLIGRLQAINSKHIIRNSEDNQNGRVGMSERDSSRQKIDEFSTASSRKEFNSCSESEAEDVGDAVLSQRFGDGSVLEENEVNAGWKFRWRDAGNSKQLSPVSVLEATDSFDGSPTETESKGRRKQLMNSVSPCKLEKRIGEEEDGSNASSQYNRNKRAVQQTKHLLFDCLREVVDKHERDSSGHRSPEILGAEQLWQLVCENLWLWSKESIDETNVTYMTHFEALASDKDWGGREVQTQEIGMLVGDAIFEDICSEFIAEMICISS